MDSPLKIIRHLALDLDGTLYLGGTVFEWTHDFLAGLPEAGVGYTFFTNNCSRSTRENIENLAAKGIHADAENLYSSAHATLDYLGETRPELRRIFVLGTTGLHEDFTEAGYTVCDDKPQAVVVGFDTGLTYDRLCQCAYWINQGLPYFATHPDMLCPTDAATLLPDCGAICKCLEAATGRPPDAVLGKPNPALLQKILKQHGLRPEELAMVGDRLYTDMAMAHAAKTVSILVLSGESTAAEAARTNPQPDLVLAHVGELGKLLGARDSVTAK